jgi:predicted phosphodiesterase
MNASPQRAIALISDIHGNLPALEAVLADVREQRVDSIVCLGDVATLGPQPRPVIALLREACSAFILGNHDAALLDLERALALQIAPPLLPTLHWCAQQLTCDEVDFLRSFAPSLTLELAVGYDLLGFHGSPQSNTDLILTTTPPEELDRLLNGRTAALFGGGHSHLQMLRQHRGKQIVNPGSVGCAFLETPAPGVIPALTPWAEYGIIRMFEGAVSVDLRRVPFDVRAYCDVLARSDLPLRDWWLGQYSATLNR